MKNNTLMMLFSTGLMPNSQAVAGVISKWNLTMLFVISGALVLLVTFWTAFHPGVKGFSESFTIWQAEG